MVKTISTSELSSKTKSLVRALENGKPVGLTHGGHRLASILPVRRVRRISAKDPIYHLHLHASAKAEALSDRDIDRIVYGGKTAVY
jgi:antitoxin (DNA-binding transcriptional repressor) of toxin-antitoxin stability system